jgi:hypothetical protein
VNDSSTAINLKAVHLIRFGDNLPRIMESSDTHCEHQGEAKRAGRSDREIYEYWKSTVTKEPISEDLKALLRADLKKKWHFERNANLRQNMRIEWATVDDYKILLEGSTGQLRSKQLEYLCNKPTAFYWLQSAQPTVASGQRAQTPGIVFAAICGEWFRSRNIERSIEFGHFFANPVRITSTGPPTVRGVIDAHLSLCKQASGFKNQLGDQVDSMTQNHTSRLQHYSLLPLYHAIVVMIDHLDRLDKRIARESDGFICLRKSALRQTVLIARTGVEEGLSAPISLESLRSQSVPLKRSDVIMQDIDVVRVSLAVAVQFIADLEVREELAFPKSRNALFEDYWLDPDDAQGSERNDQVCRNSEAWADACIIAAEKYGCDNIFETWQSIRRVQASLVGEDFYELEHVPFGNSWKYCDSGLLSSTPRAGPLSPICSGRACS